MHEFSILRLQISDLHTIKHILAFLCNFCRPVKVVMCQVTASGLKLDEYMRVVAGLQRMWKEWEFECGTANISLGTLQVTVAGGVGNTQALYIRLGPFMQP